MIEPRNPPGAPVRHVVEASTRRDSPDAPMGTLYRTVVARLSCGHTREFPSMPRKRAAAMARKLENEGSAAKVRCFRCAQERRECEE